MEEHINRYVFFLRLSSIKSIIVREINIFVSFMNQKEFLFSRITKDQKVLLIETTYNAYNRFSNDSNVKILLLNVFDILLDVSDYIHPFDKISNIDYTGWLIRLCSLIICRENDVNIICLFVCLINRVISSDIGYGDLLLSSSCIFKKLSMRFEELSQLLLWETEFCQEFYYLIDYCFNDPDKHVIISNGVMEYIIKLFMYSSQDVKVFSFCMLNKYLFNYKGKKIFFTIDFVENIISWIENTVQNENYLLMLINLVDLTINRTEFSIEYFTSIYSLFVNRLINKFMINIFINIFETSLVKYPELYHTHYAEHIVEIAIQQKPNTNLSLIKNILNERYIKENFTLISRKDIFMSLLNMFTMKLIKSEREQLTQIMFGFLKYGYVNSNDYSILFKKHNPTLYTTENYSYMIDSIYNIFIHKSLKSKCTFIIKKNIGFDNKILKLYSYAFD